MQRKHAFALALVLVYATFNPTGYSLFHWITAILVLVGRSVRASYCVWIVTAAASVGCMVTAVG